MYVDVYVCMYVCVYVCVCVCVTTTKTFATSGIIGSLISFVSKEIYVQDDREDVILPRILKLIVPSACPHQTSMQCSALTKVLLSVFKAVSLVSQA